MAQKSHRLICFFGAFSCSGEPQVDLARGFTEAHLVW
jgi:hypothetical protein